MWQVTQHYPILNLPNGWYKLFDRKLSESFEQADVFNKQMTKPFELADVLDKWMTKPVEWMDVSIEWMTKAFQTDANFSE